MLYYQVDMPPRHFLPSHLPALCCLWHCGISRTCPSSLLAMPINAPHCSIQAALEEHICSSLAAPVLWICTGHLHDGVLPSLRRLLQRPAAVPGGRSGADEARSANEMRILRMNQPFPTIFAREEVRPLLLPSPLTPIRQVFLAHIARW